MGRSRGRLEGLEGNHNEIKKFERVLRGIREGLRELRGSEGGSDGDVGGNCRS